MNISEEIFTTIMTIISGYPEQILASEILKKINIIRQENYQISMGKASFKLIIDTLQVQGFIDREIIYD